MLDYALMIPHFEMWSRKIKELQFKLLGKTTKQKIKVYTPSYPNLENGVVQEIK